MGAPKPKRVGVCPWNKPRSTARRMESAAQWLSGTSEKPVEAAAAGAGSAAVTSRAQSSAQEQNHCSRLFMLSFFAPLASDFFQILAEMPGFALCRYAIVPESAAAVKRTVSELKSQ